jgi:hypothetical protein
MFEEFNLSSIEKMRWLEPKKTVKMKNFGFSSNKTT